MLLSKSSKVEPKTTVIILAGGLATRLHPLTHDFPKVLLDISGKPFLFHQIEKLEEQNFEDVIVSVGYKGELVEEALKESKWQRADSPLRVKVVYDGDELLGTGGAVLKILKENGDVSDPFMVIYGDSYLPGDYREMISKLGSLDQALMTVFKNSGKYDKSNVVFCEGSIVDYNKKGEGPQYNSIDWGLNVFRQEAFDLFHEQGLKKFDLSDVFTAALKEQKLKGCEVFERFYEIGSHLGLEELRSLLK